MGTRAQFFIGDPQDLENRKWLGCVAWDGYPDGYIGKALKGVKTAEKFEAAVKKIAAKRDDFTDPETMDFPFPWRDDLFLTDWTYAFMGEQVMATCFHGGFYPLDIMMRVQDREELEEAGETAPRLPSNVPAPRGKGEKRGPDSIMYFVARGE